MGIEIWTILLFVGLFALVFSGLPVGFSLGGVAMVFILIFWGPQGLYMAAAQSWGASNQFVLVAIPLFVFMAMIIERSGIADELYQTMYIWFGPVRGGLAVGTVLICTIFAAMCGISGTATITMGAIALPSMLKRNYKKTLAIGCINSGGGWGILMPPSIDMILYALIAGESVGRMFAGGVLPTLLLLTLDTGYILIRSYFQPSLAPAIPKEQRASMAVKLASLKSVLFPAMIIVMVLGSILTGLASPTEAAAIGVAGSVIAARRKLNLRLLLEAARKALVITGTIMWIVFGAYCFSAIFQGMGGPKVIASLLEYIPAGRWGVIVFFQLVIFFLAMTMGSLGIMLITIPIMLPVVKALGFDPLWFGILFIVQMEIGYMTPPFGYNLFYMKAVAPKGVTMGDIYKSVIAFTLVELTGLAVIILFPKIATWLPDLLFPLTR